MLVGNFGDGEIHAYNAASGAFLGTITNPGHNPIVNRGPWGLKFGNGGLPNSLYLTDGAADEGSGVFARIEATTAPGAIDDRIVCARRPIRLRTPAPPTGSALTRSPVTTSHSSR